MDETLAQNALPLVITRPIVPGTDDHEPEQIVIDHHGTPNPSGAVFNGHHHGRVVGVVRGANNVTIPPTMGHPHSTKYVRSADKNVDGFPVFVKEGP